MYCCYCVAKYIKKHSWQKSLQIRNFAKTTTYSFVFNAAKKSLNKSLRDCIILYYTLIVFNDIVICYAHKVEWI